MSPFTRPETVIRRADELLSVNQPLAALSSLSEVFSSKRFRTTPLTILEPILIKFLLLCVDLRKGRTAKEGLHMYKNVAQNLSVNSVEIVVGKFLEASREKLAEAIKKVEELEGEKEGEKEVKEEGEEVEDLEASETPESILLGSVSEEKSRDRTTRAIVTPWLRFLWEAYRTALDTLRNNARLEGLYQTVSHDAFAFCLTHSRKTEFRRLSEMLRSHLLSSQKYSNQTHSINLNDPETLQRHLDTRFAQLNTAVELELWQEGFRTAEDIHGLIGMSKRSPKASMMVSFYEKMVKVFGVGQNYLFHAAAYGKLYSLSSHTAAAGDDKDGDKLSGLVLLSALSVPIGSGILGSRADAATGGEEGEHKGKAGRLAALLGLSSTPTRGGLIADAINRHALKRVSPELQSLYQILEVDFHPLSITSKISPILESLSSNPDTARYVAPLKEVVLARLFQQLAEVYSELKIERVVKLATFAGDGGEQEGETRKRVERFVTEACRKGDLDVTIDHATGSIKFDQDLFSGDAAPAVPVASTSASTSASTLESSVKTLLQPSASTLLRTHLTRLAQTLSSTLNSVSPLTSPLASALASKALAFSTMESQCQSERSLLLSRIQIIKRRKELADEQIARKEKEEAHARTVRAAQIAEEETKRAADEVKRKQMEKIQKDLRDDRKKEMEKALKALLERTGQPAPVIAEEEMSADKIFQLGVQHIEKEKRELAAKLTGVSKRIDHLERAFRKEEIPLLKKDYELQQTRDREQHVSSQAKRVELLKLQHDQDLLIKQRLTSIMPDYREFRTKVEKDSRAAFEKKAATLKEQLEEAKAARKEEVLAKRAKEAEAKKAREAEEAAQRAAEEEQARLEEEARAEEEAEKAAIEERQRRLISEAEEKRKAERAAREAERAADLEKIRQQQQREEEALAKRQNGLRPPAKTTTGPPAVGSAEWRAQRDAAASASASSGTGERPRFQLAPRTTPVPVAAAAPTPAAVAATPPPAASTPAEPKKPSWRDREAAKASGGATPPPPSASTPPVSSTPASTRPSGTWSSRREAGGAPADSPTPQGEEDGFQAPKKAYRPPGARTGGAGGGGSRW